MTDQPTPTPSQDAPRCVCGDLISEHFTRDRFASLRSGNDVPETDTVMCARCWERNDQPFIHTPAAMLTRPSQDAEGDGLTAARIEAVSAAISSAVEDVQPNIPMIAGEAFNAGESAIREPYEALVEARGWSARVEYDGQFALVIEWPGEPPYGRYWWVLCPAAATLHDDPPSEDEDPTEHDHGACSLSPECDFNELHALAHQAIRDRAAALESLGVRKDGM